VAGQVTMTADHTKLPSKLHVSVTPEETRFLLLQLSLLLVSSYVILLLIGAVFFSFRNIKFSFSCQPSALSSDVATFLQCLLMVVFNSGSNSEQ
jgi:hypothetical protein